MKIGGVGIPLPPEPKARLSTQVEILLALGDGRMDLWEFSEGLRPSANFWEDFFYPALRDVLRHVKYERADFAERIKRKAPRPKTNMNAQRNYALELFISHSQQGSGNCKGPD